MRFDKLNSIIPYATGGKQKILSMQPYNAITLALPGRHSDQTVPVGGDFVVMVDDENKNWTKHQFTHTDLFQDLAARNGSANKLMQHYLHVVRDGADPDKMDVENLSLSWCIHPQSFLYAVQCLAVAEHRRYAKYESQWGGRFLPFRFAAGITQGLWTHAEAADKQRFGRPAVERLEKTYGVPTLTKELMND